MSSSVSKTVLEEDEYMEAMDKIIERDFYPHLRKLKRHAMWLEAVENNDVQLQRQIRRNIVSEQRKFGATPSETFHSTGEDRSDKKMNSHSSWDHDTPARNNALIVTERSAVTELETEENAPNSVDTDNLSLNRFIASHTSEDNASFAEIHEKDIKAHRRKYHWAYDIDEEKGDPKLLLLKDGSYMSKERRLLMDSACEAKYGTRDDRPAAPESWKFRARNQLLFVPDLETSKDICKVDVVAGEKLALENGSALHLRIGCAPRPPKAIKYENSRFIGQFMHDQEKVIMDCERQQYEVITPAPEVKGYDFVRMTPSPAPGLDSSPLMTWGDIEGTPMILDPNQTPGRSFQIAELSSREATARRLEKSGSFTIRKSLKSKNASTPAFNTLQNRTQNRSFGQLTPAAQSIARRLSSVGRSGSSLMTPVRTSRSYVGKSQSRKRPPSQPTAAAASKKKGTEITDDLLKI